MPGVAGKAGPRSGRGGGGDGNGGGPSGGGRTGGLGTSGRPSGGHAHAPHLEDGPALEWPAHGRAGQRRRVAVSALRSGRNRGGAPGGAGRATLRGGVGAARAIEARFGPAPEPAQREKEVERGGAGDARGRTAGLRVLDLVVTVARSWAFSGHRSGHDRGVSGARSRRRAGRPLELAGGIWVALLTTVRMAGRGDPRRGGPLRGFEGVDRPRRRPTWKTSRPGCFSPRRRPPRRVGRRMKLARRARTSPGRVTSRPWFDVVFLLLFFFMLAAALRRRRRLALRPRGATESLE